MPTYEYECHKCGKHFDYFQRMTDEPMKECPVSICEEEQWGHGELKRLVTGGTGLIFKGSGFYITDYARKNTAAVSAPKSKSKSDSGAAATADKAAKPEKTKTNGNSKS